jgi:hypothetical protein
MRSSRLRSTRCQRCCIAPIWINRESFLATSAFFGTNPEGAWITSGLPVIQPELPF